MSSQNKRGGSEQDGHYHQHKEPVCVFNVRNALKEQIMAVNKHVNDLMTC